MKLSPQWLREFVDLTVDDRRLAEDLTSIGIAVEGISGEGERRVFEMEIGTNRPDAMNHYGIAREASALYQVSLKPLRASADSAAFANRANSHIYQGEYDTAIADYTEAIRLDPKSALTFRNRGDAYMNEGDYDRAMADYNEAIRLEPKSALALSDRGVAYATRFRRARRY